MTETALLNSEKAHKEFYEQRYLDGYMEEWDEDKKNKVKDIIKNLNLPHKGKLLDFGCGNGVFTHILKQVLPEWDVYGVEISSVAVENARRKFPECYFFTAEDSKNYEYQFDFLFSHHVIEHVESLTETFDIINKFLKPSSYQLHILPCRNEDSLEYRISTLKRNGIEKDKENRFFFEESGHLRRLNSREFTEHEKRIGFTLNKEFYSNQYYGAINWITKSSPRFVKKLTDTKDAIDESAKKELKELRKKLLPLTYLQFPYSKYWFIKNKWHKKLSDRLKLIALAIPSLVSKVIYMNLEKESRNEWQNKKQERNGSEMFLFFTR